MTPGTRNDGLRLQLSASDQYFMRMTGNLAGVTFLAASARNGPGIGYLTATFGGLSWTSPGSSMPGPVTLIPGDGTYMLEDGADPSMWIRVQVYASYLPLSGQTAVHLYDTYDSFGPDDVSAANALAGITETVAFTLKNVSPGSAFNVKAWLDPATANVTISSDNVNFYDPVSSTDANVLTWASIAAGASANLWLRRIIGASASSNAGILNLMQFSWSGV